MAVCLSEIMVHCDSFRVKCFFEEFSRQFLFFSVIVVWSLLFCFTDFMALAGQASTQMLHVLPTHFSLLKLDCVVFVDADGFHWAERDAGAAAEAFFVINFD